MTLKELITSEYRYWIAFIRCKLGLQKWMYGIRPYWLYRAVSNDVKPLFTEHKLK